MDILILDSWLREFLDTKATPAEIAKYVSLCGPSIERIHKKGEDYVYEIEITTNRIDEVGVYGIAREASVILPRFGIPAKLKKLDLHSEKFTFVKKASYLDVKIDESLCPRFTAVLIKNVKIGQSPKIIKDRLESADIRPINNIVDISNYLMLEIGQPMHTFDYDKIKGKKMLLRESKKGERITTLDGKEFVLPGGDIVIEDGDSKLIDLAGVMGGLASCVDESTKNVLLFVQTYDPAKIRKTSMSLAQRTMAATIFEKGTDTELVTDGILSGIKLFKDLTDGEPDKNILNLYPHPYKAKSISISLDYIVSRLGIEISKKDITTYLHNLGFECAWKGNILKADIPSFRAKDIKEKEDILEEIARIYGYHNLPSHIMEGPIPERLSDPKFTFENNIKNILSGFGGNEIYTLALTSKDAVDEKSLKVKNPLGPETEYLRTSLMPSLIESCKGNVGTFEKFHLFEIANTYIPRTNDLPVENAMLAGIFYGYDYREAKGIVEALLDRLNASFHFSSEDAKGFDASKCAFVYSDDKYIGKIGFPENTNYIYYEFEIDSLIKASQKVVTFTPISKYPDQIEDITFKMPAKTKIGDVISLIKSSNKLVKNVELKDVYNESITFRIWFHDNKKTLTDSEVEEIRKDIILSVKNKFGGNI